MRKHYADDFKAKVGLEALEGAITVNELASKYGVHPNMITEWKRRIKDGAGALFARKKDEKIRNAEEQRDELFKQIGKLKVENDFLKKNAFKRSGQTSHDRAIRQADERSEPMPSSWRGDVELLSLEAEAQPWQLCDEARVRRDGMLDSAVAGVSQASDVRLPPHDADALASRLQGHQRTESEASYEAHAS